MSSEPPKTKKKSFLANLFGEMPSLADLEEASNRSKHTQGNPTDAVTVKKENPTDVVAVKKENPDMSSPLNENRTQIQNDSLAQQIKSNNSLSIDELLDYINVSNKERKDCSQHVTPPYSPPPPSHGLEDFEKKKIKEKKTRKNRKRKNAKKATLKHKDRPEATIDDMEFDSLLDSYTQVQQEKKRKHEEVEVQDVKKEPNDIMDVAAEILGRPVKKPKHPQKQQQHHNHQKADQHMKQQQHHKHQKADQHMKQQQNKINNNTQNGDNEKKNTHQNKKNIKKEWMPEKLCVFWQAGHCKDGDKCTFKHEGEQNKKLCQFIQSQSCEKGIHCEFSHDLKSEPCRFYFVDNCKAEDDCPYYHGELTENMKEKLHRMTGYCRFFHFKGYCNSGDKCPFSHEPITDQEELRKLESSITPCKYFKLGKCKAGDECFYNH